MGLFNNKPKKLKPRKITLAQAIEYAKDPEYNKLYEFIPVDEDDIKKGYLPKLKTELYRKNYNEENKTKRNQNFLNRIKVDKIYEETNKNKETIYGNYKSAKKYEGNIR